MPEEHGTAHPDLVAREAYSFVRPGVVVPRVGTSHPDLEAREAELHGLPSVVAPLKKRHAER